MEADWMIIGIVVAFAVILIVYLIWRNQRDKKNLAKKIIGEDEATLPKEPDTEIETND